MKKLVAKPSDEIPFFSAAFFEQVAENIEQVIWLRDNASGQILYVSPTFESVWGRSCESLYANPKILIESVHPEDRVQVMVARDHSNHKPYDQVYRIIRPDDSQRWIATHSFLVRSGLDETSFTGLYSARCDPPKPGGSGVTQSVGSIPRTIHPEPAHEPGAKTGSWCLKTLMSAHELRPAQRAAMLFFDNPKAGPGHGVELTAAWESSPDKPAWLSESALYEEPQFWGLVQPSRPVVINGTRTNSRLTSLLRDFLLEGKIQSSVLFPLVTSGVWLGCLVVYYEEDTNFSHNELGHLKVLIDQATITLYNLKLLEVEAESRHEAERANEIKTEFLAMISHELRTPLTSIIGFTTTLLAKDVTWEPAEQIDFIQTIQQESFRLQELIDHLLDLSRLEAGRLPILLKPHSTA